jgi:protein-disulfide isomerase
MPSAPHRSLATKCLQSVLFLLLAAQAQAQAPWITMDGRAIESLEVAKALPGAYLKVQTAAYQERKQMLERFLREHLFTLEATKRGLGLEAFKKKEIEGRLPAVTDRDVRALYGALKGLVGGDIKNLEGLRPMLERQLRDGAREERTEQLFRDLLTHHQVAFQLERPRVTVDPGNLPADGPADALVTLVAFTDLQCPYCRRLEETVMPDLLRAYPGKLRILHRDFPLKNHAQALPAALAARAAAAQGRFWPYRSRLLQSPNLDEADLLGAAREVGLDLARFAVDRKRPETLVAVVRDQDDAERLGVDGTPSFFINGIPLKGAMPVEDFKEIIEEELGLRPKGQFRVAGPAGAKETCSDDIRKLD